MDILPTEFFKNPTETTIAINKYRLNSILAWSHGSIQAYNHIVYNIKSKCIGPDLYKVWLEKDLEFSKW